MQQRLAETNRDLFHQLAVLRASLTEASVADAMRPFVDSVLAMCTSIEQEVQRHLKDLEYGLADTLPDILEATQRVTALFELVNTRFASPIIRYREEDKLALLLLQWVHREHEITRDKPFAVSDGGFSIYPTPEWPVVYLLPISRRKTLLYLPLLFHEFGHLLYACRRQELDELVREFQDKVGRMLAPMTLRDRGSARSDDSLRQAVVSAWYSWAQEVFCDAIGLEIGGTCYLRTFSHYFRFKSSQEYYLPRDEQLRRGHPVTRLRTTMLLDRARERGLSSVADAVEDVWADTARTLGLDEDYEGTWADELFQPLRRTIDDMIEECSPLRFGDQVDESPVGLIDEAWTRFESTETGFFDWEEQAVARFIARRE